MAGEASRSGRWLAWAGHPGTGLERACVLALLALLLVLGVTSYRDYGLSWDEAVQREQAGLVPHGYVTEVVERGRVLPYPNRYPYGPVFSLTAVCLEKALGLEDLRDVYFLRHLLGFLLFVAAVAAFHSIGKRIFGDWRLGLVGAAFLVASPRIYAHAFYNPKDTPFMSLCIVGILTLLRLLERREPRRAALHGLVCALVVDMRIPGLFLPGLTGVFLGLELMREARPGRRDPAAMRRTLGAGLLFGAVFCASVVAFWPRLWHAPLGVLEGSLSVMSRYPSPETVLYLGETIPRAAVPWSYAPVWVAITTPPVHLVFVLLGFGLLGLGLLQAVAPNRLTQPIFASARRAWGMRGMQIALAWLFVPWLIIVLRGATLYDGWRHLFFVYPALLLIAVLGVQGALVALVAHAQSSRESGDEGRGARVRTGIWLVWCVLLVGFLDTAAFMVRSHPHQNVYFNVLVGGVEGARGRFDLDYWGTAYRQGLEYILEHDDSDRITVLVANAPGRLNRDILTPEQRARIEFVDDSASADYFMSIHKNESREFPIGAWGQVEVDGVRILGIYRTRLAVR